MFLFLHFFNKLHGLACLVGWKEYFKRFPEHLLFASAGDNRDNEVEKIEEYIHQTCGIEYKKTDIITYIQELVDKNGAAKFIRGKYIKLFFVMIVNSIYKLSIEILPSKRMPKTHISLGIGNALLLLCGIIRTPSSLDAFIKRTCVNFTSG